MKILFCHVRRTWATAFVQGDHDYLVQVLLPGRPLAARRPGHDRSQSIGLRRIETGSALHRD